MTKLSEIPFSESLAIWKRPHDGKCSKSSFANGYHRTGLFAISCLLDGACAGNSCREICLHCGKVFQGGWFVIKDQPNRFNASLGSLIRVKSGQ